MSFILDALKKSQASRQRHAGPGTITVETAPLQQQQHNWWAVVITIVVINLAVIAGLIYWGDRDRQTQTATDTARQAGPASSTGAALPGQTDPLPTTATRTAAATPGARGEVSPLSAEVKEPRIAAADAATVAPAQTFPPPVPASASTPATETDYLPTLTELQLENRIALSPMHVDVHVYNEDPRRRFVLINTRKYKEGERLTEGPLLESIRRDGVVLYYRGQRFLLPRD